LHFTNHVNVHYAKEREGRATFLEMANVLENKNTSVEVKFAHGEGHTVFAISDDSKWLLTGGIDGEVRKWSLEAGKEDEDPESFDVGSPIFALQIAVS
jgi:WD40 repeat protein